MEVYRFQNTKGIETSSYCEDIMNIWFSFRGEEAEDFEVTEELVDEVYEEWGPFIDQRLSTEDFADLSVFEWVEKILSFETEGEAYAFQMQHKLEGVFAIEPTVTLEEAFELSKSPELGLGNKYPVIGEAEVIEKFPKPFGLLVKFEEIKEVIEIPQKYKK